MFALLLDHDAAVEHWAHGREPVVPATSATVLERVLRQHRRRFRLAAASDVRGQAPNDQPGGTPVIRDRDGRRRPATRPARSRVAAPRGAFREPRAIHVDTRDVECRFRSFSDLPQTLLPPNAAAWKPADFVVRP